MKTRIAYVIPTLSLGGAEKQQINILNGINTNRYDVKLYILRSNIKLLPQLENKEIEVVICNINSIFSFKGISLFLGHIKKFNPEIIHSQMYNANIIVRLLKYFFPKVKIVNHYHGMSAWISRLKLFVDNITSSKVNSFIVVSDKSLELRKKREKYPEKKLTLLYNSVNLDISIDKNKFDKNKPLLIGMASRLIPLKNIEAALFMLSKLLAKGLDVRLIVAGDGPELDNLINVSQELNIEKKVEFLGFVKDMNSFYKEIDLYCISSTTEDLPLSVIEAMLSGKPIIASNVGGIPDILNDILYTVLVKDFYDENEVQNIYSMISNCHEKSCSAYLYKIAYERYDNSMYCKKLENIYRIILKENK